MLHTYGVLVEVEVPRVVGEASSFGNYLKATIIRGLLSLVADYEYSR